MAKPHFEHHVGQNMIKVSRTRDQSRFIIIHYNSLFLSLIIVILIIIIILTPPIEDQRTCPVTIGQDNHKKTHKNIKDKNLV